MEQLVTTAIIFIMTVSVIEMFLYAYRTLKNPHRKKIKKRLSRYLVQEEEKKTDIVRKRVFSDIPTFNELLSRISGIKKLDRLLQQANVKYPLSVFILLSAIMGFAAFLISNEMTRNTLLSLIIGLSSAYAPFLYLIGKKKKRIGKFQKQLPDGLDLLSRALRAGHAFTSGMKLAADEFDDPLGPEFQKTLEMINFGVSVPEALKKLTARIDCPELKYFVVSVILQRETGGNLAEIIESLAGLVRKRFKLQDKVKVLSAEGKLSATILIALPFLVVGFLKFSNPDYLSILVDDPTGRMIAGFAGFLMLLGVVIVKKMINIKV